MEKYEYRYCTSLKKKVEIVCIPQTDSKVRLLACVHTFRKGIEPECDLPCVYSFGCQLGGKIAIKMGTKLELNPDFTIPVDYLKSDYFQDFTKDS